MSTIVLVRHGQTEWNRVERFRGRVDIALNSNGLTQARQTAARIHKAWTPEGIFSSPLIRALQTANAIADITHNQVEPLADLIDIDYGEWHGLTPEEARSRWPDQIEAWYRCPEQVLIPGGESLLAVQTRAMSAVKSVITKYPQAATVMVSHTVVNRLILLGILGLGLEHFWQLRQEPCAINVIEATSEGFSLVKMNDICHLAE